MVLGSGFGRGGPIGFELCVFIVGWRHAFRSALRFDSIATRQQSAFA